MRPELLHCIVTPVTARVTIYLNLSWSKSKFSAYTCGYYLVSRGWGRYRAYAELTTYTSKCRSASMNSSKTLPILHLGKYLLIILPWIRRLLALFQFSEEVTVWRKPLRDSGHRSKPVLMTFSLWNYRFSSNLVMNIFKVRFGQLLRCRIMLHTV